MKSSRLSISFMFNFNWKPLLTTILQRILSISRIYHLEFYCRISYDLLTQLRLQLPDIQSIQIYAFLPEENPDLLHMMLWCESLNELNFDFVDEMDIRGIFQDLLQTVKENHKNLRKLSFRMRGFDVQIY